MREQPRILQIEVTNRCNFDCRFCIRQVWNVKPLDFNLDLYKKLAKTAFPNLDKLILYGFGEPFVNPNLREMVRVARRYLPKDGEILINTNGSLLESKVADKLLTEIGVGSISFSIDTIEASKFEYIRRGSKPKAVWKNLHYVARIKDRVVEDFRLGVEIVMMRSNYNELPDLISKLAHEGVDYIVVSHLIPYSDELYGDIAYTTVSRRPFEIARSALKLRPYLILDATVDLLKTTYGFNHRSEASKILRKIWDEAEKEGYWINLPLIINSIDHFKFLSEVERVLDKSLKISREYGVELKIPTVYPESNMRICPYIDKDATFIRADGMVTPCLEFAYTHPEYINGHKKIVYEVVFGNVWRENLNDIWCKDDYVSFRDVRRRISETVPWCGDCPYSATGCFFVKTNETDCYINRYGCNECLYSAGIAQCNI